MSRSRPATPEQVRAAFDRLLASGGELGMPSDTGLDEVTMAAIQRAWDAPGNRLNQAAKHELELQLDGTHLAEAQTRQAAAFASVSERT